MENYTMMARDLTAGRSHMLTILLSIDEYSISKHVCTEVFARSLDI